MPPRGLGPRGRQVLDEAAAAFHPPPHRANPAVITQEETDTPENWRSFSSSRVSEAAYDPASERLFVRWVKPGRPYVYEGVTRAEWRNLRRAKSAGKFVNRVLNTKDYSPGDF